MKKIISILSLLLSASLAITAQKNVGDLDKKIKEFDAYTQQALKQWEVPGAGVAVIKDGKVIYIKAFGTRNLDTGAPANTETLFSIGSTTKAMTAVCIGMLVDEGKLKWSDPVVKYLPEFQLYDPFVTRDLKIRDLLIHDSGLGNTDFLWGLMDIPESEILARMRMVKPTYSLRDGFIYQNIFYIAAGQVIERVSGKTWATFITERIFNPLSMTRTATKLKAIKDDNYTKPHMKYDGKIQVILHTKDDAVGAAGSVWSSITDMAKWTVCMLDSSKYAGGRLLNKGTWMEMFKPQTLVTSGEFYPTQRLTKPNWMTYGLGWFQHDYKGHKINFHTGSLNGLIALHAQLPDQNLGYYFLGNYDHAEVRHALMYKTFDLFSLGGNRDWSSEFKTLYDGIREGGQKQLEKMESQRVLNTKPTLPVSAYAGKYTDPLYGEIEITATETGLRMNINQFAFANLEHWNYDTFYGKWDRAWDGKVWAQFLLSPTGKVDRISVEGIEMRKTGY